MKKILEMAKGNSELISKLNLEKLVDEYFVSLVNQSKLSASRNSLAIFAKVWP